MANRHDRDLENKDPLKLTHNLILPLTIEIQFAADASSSSSC